MNRVQHDLVQGTGPWQHFRLEHHGASEAAAMLGLSLTMKRSELLRMKNSGLPREFSEWLQTHVLDHGHAVEAMARPHIEAIVGTDLYPVTYSLGKLSASCDGLDMAEYIAMEHKQWSNSLAARVQAGEMPAEHMPQCQQVMLVTGASRCIFVVSDGTPKSMVWLWVESDPAWHQRLIDGWAQFDKDLSSYVQPEAEAPAPVGKAPETLPALNIEVTGMVTHSNLAEFKETALAAIGSVNRNLQTDQDFADADKAIKWCEDVESRIKAAKEHALSQTASIDELFRVLDDISAKSKAARLDMTKLRDRRKTERKEEAVTAARKALDTHLAALSAELVPMRMLPAPADFAGAIKGLRSIASMQDALDTTLASAKIAADAQARLIRGNLASFKAPAAGLEFLFADLSQLVHKPADDFVLLVEGRIAKHRADEADKKRKAGHEARIAEIHAAAAGHESATAADLYEAMVAVTALDVSEALYQEYTSLAMAAQDATLAALQDLHFKAVEREEETEAARQRAITPAANVATAAATEGKAETPEPGTLEAAPDDRAPIPAGGFVMVVQAESTVYAQLAGPAPVGPGVTLICGEAGHIDAGITFVESPAMTHAAFLSLVMQAFDCKFPSYPKPSQAWWSKVRAAGHDLQQAAA